jgi:thiol-disulfide isomerase/thioredoxin
MPILNKIKKQFGDKCNYVAITFDPKDKVQKILSKVNFDFTQIVNNKQLTKKMGFNSYPSNIFLDKNGIVRQIEGGVSYVQNEQGELTIGTGEEFVKIIEKYIGEK